jgi:uncharacterized protein (DUF169 family)
MNFAEMHKQFIWNVRLDFDPVGIRFVYDEKEIETLPVTHRAKAKITYCQFLAACRQQRSALFMEPKKLLCQNAYPVFSFRDLDKEADTKRHMKYLQDEAVAWEAPLQKAKLEKGCLGIYMAPLDYFDKTDLAPSLVFFVTTPYQAYHLLNDYMGATKKPNLQFFHTPNSAVCSGSVYSHVNHTANMTTMCAGSKTSGKTEMNYVNLFVPGDQINAMAEQQKMRVEKGEGASLLGKGSQSWPGLDACKGCPMFKFEAV